MAQSLWQNPKSTSTGSARAGPGERILVCGHSHCGAIRVAYEGAPEEAIALKAWPKLAQEALLPVQPSPQALAHTEQRCVVVQLERPMAYLMVRREV